jgi:hypothetical protein
VRQDHLYSDKKVEAGSRDSGQGYPAIMAALEASASEGDGAGFAASLARLNWETFSADDLIGVLKLALKAGAHLEARRLSALALRQYPDHPDVKKFARILSPPRVISSSLPPAPDVEANRAWLKAHYGQYAGQWVALSAGELLAVGASPKELEVVIGNTRGVLLTVAR